MHVSFIFVEEIEPLGTGGPVRLFEGQVDPSGEMRSVDGEVVTDLDLSELLRVHVQLGCNLTMCSKEFHDTSLSGVQKIEGAEIVEGRSEKA